MLTNALARTGQPVLILNGKLLASKFDPLAEAKKWVDGLSPLASESQVLFVLGAGSGYALVELTQKYPKSEIIVFTTELEIITFWQNHFKHELSQVKFHHLTSVEEYLQGENFFETIEKTFMVFEHPSALVEDSSLLRILKEALLGRTYSSFTAQAQNHSSYTELSQVLLPTIGALSIKNLADSLSLAQDIEAQSRSEILVLRELVK